MIKSSIKPVWLACQRAMLERYSRRHYDGPADPRQVNRLELRVFGLRRSGNHAVINWILVNQQGTLFFLNNVNVRKHLNPFVAFGRAYVTEGGRTVHLPPARPWATVPRARTLRQRHPRRDCLIYSYEDKEVRGPHIEAVEQRHDQWLGRSERRFEVVILRDPFNGFASRVRNGFPLDDGVVALWKAHARECLGETDQLGDARLFIDYNRWFTSAEHRAQLAGRLGLASDDRGLETVPDVGGGSSVDATRFDGRARQMNVLERWRALEDDGSFRAIFRRDPELVELSRRIFGDLAGTETLLEG